VVDTPQLQPSDLSRLLLTLQDEFEWATRSESFDLVERWRRDRSGSAFYHMTGSPDGPAVVLKVVDEWTPRDAESMFQAMTDLADVVEGAGIEGAFGIRPVGWAGDPPLVVMPYIEGTDVVSILRQPEHEAWRHLGSWMIETGQMLAVYHQRHRAHAATAALVDDVRELAARFRIDRRSIDGTLAEIDPEQRSARSFGDIGPGNLHGASNGDLYLLDPPGASGLALVHRDLGNFVFELRRQLAGRGYTRSRPVKGHFERLRSAFLEGYSLRSHGGPLTPADEALIALFEARRATGMARKRMPSRPGDALWFARLAISRRQDV
jgi:hypothetical protein